MLQRLPVARRARVGFRFGAFLTPLPAFDFAFAFIRIKSSTRVSFDGTPTALSAKWLRCGYDGRWRRHLQAVSFNVSGEHAGHRAEHDLVPDSEEPDRGVSVLDGVDERIFKRWRQSRLDGRDAVSVHAHFLDVAQCNLTRPIRHRRQRDWQVF